MARGDASGLTRADLYLLLRREHSVENLYFDAWLRTYTALTESAINSDKAFHQLVDSVNFAMSTFLHPSSLLEVNVSAQIRAGLAATLAASGDGFLPPKAFGPLHGEVRDALRHSLARFVRQQRGNSGVKRAWMALAIAVFEFLLGWVPCVLTAVIGGNRAWRVLGLPFFLFGGWIFYCGLNNVGHIPYGRRCCRYSCAWTRADAPCRSRIADVLDGLPRWRRARRLLAPALAL